MHPGFSVFAGPAADGAALTSLEAQGRYITRPAMAMEALRQRDDGNLVLETPPDPRSGAASVALDPIAWIHRVTAHIPDPGRQLQRRYPKHPWPEPGNQYLSR